jgi:membrane-bound lytic murein transglycosylase A
VAASTRPGRHARIGFDGSNSRPYPAIGGVLADMGMLRRDDLTWPAIRDWLKRNPQQGRDVMRKNRRYIFQGHPASAAAGSEGVSLTASAASRSTRCSPTAPIWIDTSRPVAGSRARPGSIVTC